MPDIISPKTFISYSWTSPAHEKWVIELATFLRQSGADVILDKWDLRDGFDKFAFMERMITDVDVKKVIIISDRLYAEKADGRTGGVGTETQIISTEIFKSAEQSKFLAVVTELDENGEGYLPTYFKNRIYRDLSTPEAYDENIEHVLRFIFDRPFNLKPDIGSPPAFLTEDIRRLPQSTLIARRVAKAIEADSPKAGAQLAEYFDSIPQLFEEFRIPKRDTAIGYDDLVENISRFIPHRDEIVGTMVKTVRLYPTEAGAMFHRTFEKLLPFTSRPEDMNSWYQNQFENFKFLINELYLYSVAAFISENKFKECAVYVSTDLYVPNPHNSGSDPMNSFAVLQQYCETIANASKSAGRLSLHADLMKARATLRTISFEQVKQADFLLYLRATVGAIAHDRGDHWYPATLLYTYNAYYPFEIFARSQSRKYFNENVSALVGVKDVEEFKSVLGQLSGQKRDYYIPRWEHNRLAVAALSNSEKLGSQP